MLGGKTFEGMTSSDEDEDEEEDEDKEGLPSLDPDDIVGDFDGARCIHRDLPPSLNDH
jgi:hypothetical protein